MKKELFDLIKKIGEGVHSELHVIKMIDDGVVKSYRCYHSDGHCFDVLREENEDYESVSVGEEIVGIGSQFYYDFTSDQFPGFKSLSVVEALNKVNLIRKSK